MMYEHDLDRSSSSTPRSRDGRPTIRVLPDATVARIAAGEIVERPASVVKELVENSLDAGARNVRVDIRGGGLSLIRVGDDGEGIPAHELWLACQRHATSKLLGDLAGVRTLGFRGEALPSIAAVSELELLSATDGSGLGHELTLREGRVAAERPAPRPQGTTVTVRHLFQNVPARLAAAGGIQLELSQIAQTVRRLALAAPHVRFSLYFDQRPVLQTTGSGDLRTALIEVHGRELASSLLPLGPVTAARATLRGVIAGPEATRPGRSQVHLIVNGRWVQPRSLLATLEAAYRPLLPRGRHPVLALCIDATPEELDVNLHPAKLEVRLLAERVIGTAAAELIREALGRRPLPLRQAFATGVEALDPPLTLAEVRAGWEDDDLIETPGLPRLRLIGQVQSRLLMLEGPAGLYLVDQHRAHERILYERLAAVDSGPTAAPLIEPLTLELRPAQMAQLGRRLDDLAALGFELEAFGGRTFLLRSAPVPTGELAALGEPEGLVPALLELVDEPAAEGEEWRERLLVRLACRTAVRRGRALDRPAMRTLVRGLGETRAPAVCPHGSPLLMHVSGSLLEREFGWT